MDAKEFLRLFQEAEAKRAAGLPLTRAEQVLLLAGRLAGQATRKEKGYGRT
jgi:hypothetical protein